MISIKCPTCGEDATCEYYTRITKIGYPGEPYRTVRCQRRPSREACKPFAEPYVREEVQGDLIPCDWLKRYDTLRQFFPCPLSTLCDWLELTKSDRDAARSYLTRKGRASSRLTMQLHQAIEWAEGERRRQEEEKFSQDLLANERAKASQQKIEDFSKLVEQAKDHARKYPKSTWDLISELVKQGLSCPKIANRLNSLGVPCFAEEWTTRIVYSMCRRLSVEFPRRRILDVSEEALAIIRDMRNKRRTTREISLALHASRIEAPGNLGAGWTIDKVQQICQEQNIPIPERTHSLKATFSLIANLVASGKSFVEIAIILNDGGHRNRWGSRWNASSVRQLCVREGYIAAPSAAPSAATTAATTASPTAGVS